MRASLAALIGLVGLCCVGSAWAGGVPVQLTSDGRLLWTVSDSGVRLVDPHNGASRAGLRPTYPYATQVVAGGGAVWISSISNGYLSGAVDRIDLATQRRTTPIRSPHLAVYAIAFGGGVLWAWLGSAQQSRTSLIERVDAAGRRLRTLRLPGRPGWIAASASGLWFTEGHGLEFIDRRTLSISAVGGVAAVSAPLAAGFGAIWVAGHGQVLRVDQRTRRVSEQVKLTPTPLLLATGDRCLWAVISDNLSRGSRLICYDPTDHEVVRSRNLSFVPTDLVLIRGDVWLGLSGVRPRLVELDAQTLRVRRRAPLVP